jgi:hypothetical protein
MELPGASVIPHPAIEQKRIPTKRGTDPHGNARSKDEPRKLRARIDVNGNVGSEGSDLFKQFSTEDTVAICDQYFRDPRLTLHQVLGVFPRQENDLRVRPSAPDKVDHGQRQNDVTDTIGTEQKDSSNVQRLEDTMMEYTQKGLERVGEGTDAGNG